MSIPDLGLDFDRLKSELGSDLGDIFHTATAAARGGLERITRAAGGTQNTLARIPQAGGGGGNPLGRIANFGSYGGGGTGLEFFDTLGGADPFASFNRAQAMFQPQQQEKTTAPTTPGAAGGQVSSSADNANLTAEAVDAWIAKTRPNSPLVGKGAYILQAANARGVSVPQMLGIMLKETELGTTAGANKNLGGIVSPSDQGLGTNRSFNGYATWEESIDAIASNLATNMYRGKTLAEQIGNWYVGPQAYAQHGVNATDLAGNGTVQDYLNVVAQVYAGLGVPFNPTATPQSLPAGGGDPGGLIQRASSLLGTPYQLGGRRTHIDTPNAGIDCSEFTAWIYEGQGIDLPWNAAQQYAKTQRVDPNQLQVGDLVFFHSTYNSADGEWVTHVGMYAGDGKMIHAGSGGVQYANLSDPYWQQHLAGYGRVQR